MGLDMFLNRHLVIMDDDQDKIYRFNTLGEGNVEVRAADLDAVVIEVGYWRKANHIHKWFVDNVQDGEDDCREYRVYIAQLKLLRDTCQKILDKQDPKEREALAKKLLPTSEGFFFGGTEYDEGYYEDLRHTIEVINKCKAPGYYYYRSSW